MEQEHVTFDTLVDAYFDAAKYADAVPELRDYHALRRGILESLFGCSLEDSARTPEGSSPVDYDERAVRRIAQACLEKCARLGGPFGVYLEGAPGPLEAGLRERHDAALDQALEGVKERYRAILRDALGVCFPSAHSRTFPAGVLQEHGLPPTRPDPFDFC